MDRLASLIAAVSLAAGLAGCCAGPCRFFQNAYGFEDPNIEYYPPGPPAPVNTPPGYETPAVAAVPEQDVTSTMPGDPNYPAGLPGTELETSPKPEDVVPGDEQVPQGLPVEDIDESRPQP